MIVEVSGDADRKRLEYLVERYSSAGLAVRKLCGGVLLVDGSGDVVRGFVDEALARFGRGRVSVWALSPPGFEVRPSRFERVFKVAEGFGDVWGVVDFVMTKLRGSLVSETGGGASRVYRVRSRYGVVDVRFDLLPGPGGSRALRVAVEGFGSAVSRVFERLVSELSYIEGG